MAPKAVQKDAIKRPAAKASSKGAAKASLTAGNLKAHEDMLSQGLKTEEQVMTYINGLQKSDQEQIWKAYSSCNITYHVSPFITLAITQHFLLLLSFFIWLHSHLFE